MSTGGREELSHSTTSPALYWPFSSPVSISPPTVISLERTSLTTQFKQLFPHPLLTTLCVPFLSTVHNQKLYTDLLIFSGVFFPPVNKLQEDGTSPVLLMTMAPGARTMPSRWQVQYLLIKQKINEILCKGKLSLTYTQSSCWKF